VRQHIDIFGARGSGELAALAHRVLFACVLYAHAAALRREQNIINLRYRRNSFGVACRPTRRVTILNRRRLRPVLAAMGE
jgi:hypothetical protein